MASVINLKGITGLAEAAKRLADLPPRMEKRILKNAIYKGATVLRDKARAKVPVDTGALKSRIIAKAKPIGAGAVWASAGVAKGEFIRGRREGKNPRRYAHLVEFGTIDTPAQPFMRPALDQQEQIFNEVFNAARVSFEEQFAKLGTGG